MSKLSNYVTIKRTLIAVKSFYIEGDITAWYDPATCYPQSNPPHHTNNVDASTLLALHLLLSNLFFSAYIP